MKTLGTLALLGAMSLAVMGCEASGRIGDDDADGEYKKTTTVERSGDGTERSKEVTVEHDVD